MRLVTQTDLDRAVETLSHSDDRLRRIAVQHGVPRLRQLDPTLPSLLRIVTDQLISLQAGAAIWRRFEARFPGCDAAHIQNCSMEDLTGVGLSRAKARCFQAVATAAAEGVLNFEELQASSNEDALRMLQRLPGIGPWTADIFLLFALGRSDAWPTGDLALQVAAHDLCGLTDRPRGKAMHLLAEAWRPWRGAAAHLLWSHYRGLKGLPQARAGE